MNTFVIDVFDEIVGALLKSRDFFPNAVLETTLDLHAAQQPARVGLTFLSVRSQRFDFRVLDIAAQNVPQGDDICPRESVQPIALSNMRVDANGMRPARAVLAERGEQRELQFVICSRM